MRSASAAELTQDLIESDAGPDGDRLGRSPLAGATRRDHGARADEAFEVGGVGVEWSELRHRSAPDGDHRAFARLGDPDRFGEARPQFSDAGRSVR